MMGNGRLRKMFGIYVVKSVWFFKIQTINLLEATVEDDVAFGLENQGLSRQEMKKRVEEALDLVGMLDFKRESQRVYQVAKRQRVAIAGVVALRPSYFNPR